MVMAGVIPTHSLLRTSGQAEMFFTVKVVDRNLMPTAYSEGKQKTKQKTKQKKSRPPMSTILDLKTTRPKMSQWMLECWCQTAEPVQTKTER